MKTLQKKLKNCIVQWKTGLIGKNDWWFSFVTKGRRLKAENFIESSKANVKPFENEILHKLPGGNSFVRMDTRNARKIILKN